MFRRYRWPWRRSPRDQRLPELKDGPTSRKAYTRFMLGEMAEEAGTL